MKSKNKKVSAYVGGLGGEKIRILLIYLIKPKQFTV